MSDFSFYSLLCLQQSKSFLINLFQLDIKITAISENHWQVVGHPTVVSALQRLFERYGIKYFGKSAFDITKEQINFTPAQMFYFRDILYDAMDDL